MMINSKVKKQVDSLFDTVEEGIKVKWLYKINGDNSARFVLGEIGKRPLVCIGVNPSTAEPDKLDPTLRSVKAWSKRLGFDGWFMLNLYPQRATNPNNLHKATDHTLRVQNREAARSLFAEFKQVTIWAAWGTLIEKRSYLEYCLNDIICLFPYICECEANWVTIGKLSNAGHPHHPLYLSLKSKVSDLDIKKYLEVFKRRVM